MEKRDELFKSSANRGQLRAHDLRATFVTLSLAAGKTESWIADRRGHTSSVMINRYRRAAGTANELGLGLLGPLHEAIPELSDAQWQQDWQQEFSENETDLDSPSDRQCEGGDLNPHGLPR
jgi:integrase